MAGVGQQVRIVCSQSYSRHNWLNEQWGLQSWDETWGQQISYRVCDNIASGMCRFCDTPVCNSDAPMVYIFVLVSLTCL